MKTRSLAARLVQAGHVRVDGIRAGNPAKTLRGGAVLTIALERHVRVLRVIAEAERRGPFREASALFEELGEPRGGPCHAAAKGLGSGLEQGAGGLIEASGERT